MKKLFLITAAVFTLFTAQSQTKKQKEQCFSFISAPSDWKVVIKETFYPDTGIKYRQYVGNDNVLVTVNYVRSAYKESYSFSADDNVKVIKYKDNHMTISSAYSHYVPCVYTWGDDDEYVTYIRGYTLINKNGNETLMVIESETEDFRNITQVLIKTSKGLVVSDIY